MLTLQLPLPVQAPFHPEKVEPESATGVRVTTVPLEKSAEQVDPLVQQEIPTGDEERVPDPVGTTERETYGVVGPYINNIEGNRYVDVPPLKGYITGDGNPV